MKLGLLILLALFTISCGKNAFTKKVGDNNITQRPGLNPNDDECPKPLHVEIETTSAKHIMHNDLPFDFKEFEQGDYSSILAQFGNLKIVELAQTELPFDFSELKNKTGAIEKIYLTFDTNQVFRPDWHHKSQLCHSFNKTCSGDYNEVADHLNPHQNFTWVDENFSNYVLGFQANVLGDGYSQRIFSGNVDMSPYFTKTMKLEDLPSDYFIVISDDHFLSNAKLHIEYCSL